MVGWDTKEGTEKETELHPDYAKWNELAVPDTGTPVQRIVHWRENLKEAARLVRTCKLRDGGYMIHEENGKRSYHGQCRSGVFNFYNDQGTDMVIDCRCRKYWKGCYRKLIEAHDAYRKTSDSDYPELTTPDMEDLKNPERGSLVDPEKFRTLRAITEQGLFNNAEPPYLPHFERFHEERTTQPPRKAW